MEGLDERRKMIIDFLPKAIESLYKGMSSLKFAMDILNERMTELERELNKFSSKIESNLNNLMKESESLREELSKFSEETPKSMKNVLDLFLDKFRRDLEMLQMHQEDILSEMSTMKVNLQDKINALTEMYGDIRKELYSVKNVLHENSLTVNSLSLSIDKNYENMKNDIHELKLLVTELSLKITALEKKFSEEIQSNIS